MSAFARDPRVLAIEAGLLVRQFGTARNVQLRIAAAEVAALLPRVIAVKDGLIDSTRLVGRPSDVRALVLIRAQQEGTRSQIESQDPSWKLTLSRDELGALARLLVEASLGIAAADHIDFDDAQNEDTITFVTDVPFVTVDESEARRRVFGGLKGE